MITQELAESLIGQDPRRSKAIELLLSPPLFLDAGIEGISQADRQFVAEWLEKIGLRALLVSVYLEERGDNGDQVALTTAAEQVEVIRTTLGHLPGRRRG